MDKIYSITDFFPRGGGTQLKSPGGFSFRLESIGAIEAHDSYFVLHFLHGGGTTFHFHRNVDGGPARVYEIVRNIEAAMKNDLTK